MILVFTFLQKYKLIWNFECEKTLYDIQKLLINLFFYIFIMSELREVYGFWGGICVQSVWKPQDFGVLNLSISYKITYVFI